MRRYLSFGGGVNSTALYILLEQEGMEFEAVFAHHGADWPETYGHIQRAQGREPLYLAHEIPSRIAASGAFARKLWRKQQKGQTNFWGLADQEQCPYCRL